MLTRTIVRRASDRKRMPLPTHILLERRRIVMEKSPHVAVLEAYFAERRRERDAKDAK